MTLLTIREDIRNNKEITNRVGFRLNIDDLNTFLNKLKHLGIKDYFERCINHFMTIEDFNDINDFVYLGTKEKAYTIVLSVDCHCELQKISNTLNISEGDLLRYMVLRTIKPY